MSIVSTSGNKRISPELIEKMQKKHHNLYRLMKLEYSIPDRIFDNHVHGDATIVFLNKHRSSGAVAFFFYRRGGHLAGGA